MSARDLFERRKRRNRYAINAGANLNLRLSIFRSSKNIYAQIIDDINYALIHDLVPYNKSVGFENPSKLHPLQQTASDYGMYEANSKMKIFNPAGEWNSSNIIFTEKQVEHWLNGKKVLSFTPWSEEWYERKSSGMYRDNKGYGEYRTGYIGFLDYGNDLWLRNIKIRKL